MFWRTVLLPLNGLKYPAGGLAFGAVSNEVFSSSWSAQSASYSAKNKCPFAGRYTLVSSRHNDQPAALRRELWHSNRRPAGHSGVCRQPGGWNDH